MNKIRNFLKEVYEELSKVTWLSRKDVIRSTIAVSIIVIIVAIYISFVDFGLSLIITNLLGGR